MAIPGQGNQFDPGLPLNPYYPPPAPGYHRGDPGFDPFPLPPPPAPPRYAPDGGPMINPDNWPWEEGPPQFLPPYTPPGPGGPPPFEQIPGGPTIEQGGPYIAGLPFRPGGGMPNQPMMPPSPGMSPGMPGVTGPPFYGPPQTGGAALTMPPPAGMSPGMPGVTGPPFYGPPQTGGAAPTLPGRGHVPTFRPGSNLGNPYLDSLNDFLYPPPPSQVPDLPWYPPLPTDGPRMLPNSMPLQPASISPPGGGMYPSLGDIGNMMMPGISGAM
jgi:hypothetical protein